MPFQIPENLDQFSVAGLHDLAKVAGTEFTTLRAKYEDLTLATDEDLDRLEELQTFRKVTIPDVLAERKDKQDRALAIDNSENEPEKTEDEKETEPEAVVASAGTDDVIQVRVSDIVGNSNAPRTVTYARPQYSALVASAGVPNYEAGAPLATMLDVAKAFEARSNSHGSTTMTSGAPVQQYPVAQLVRNYPDEFSVQGDSTDYNKLLAVSDETRLPGGSLLRSVELSRKRILEEHPERDALVAAQGWCAPSETDYDICLQITTDGLADWPEVQARRGGIRHNTGIEFDTIFGTGTGYFNLTEAEVAAGTVKTCLEIPCPEFIDTRLGVTGLCLTGNILAIRGYPEFTATFTRGALAASAHQINREQIADVVAGSTAVTLSGAPWATDASVVSQVLSAIEVASVDIKYRLRMSRSATLEAIFPFWILAQMRADWIRRNATGSGPEAITLADSAITAAMSARGVRAQFVYDWQDAFSTPGMVSGGPGSDTPITALPTSLQFLMYPAGTWIRAVSDVITLNSVYDSTKLATNQVTHLFTETGWAMVKMCPVSRVYTIGICPNGKTGLQRDVTC